MGLGADLQANVNQFLKTSWTRTEGREVPEPEAVGMGNHGVELKEAVCLYADLADSTGLVSTFADWFAAVVFKSFLHCSVKIIIGEGGAITSFDGDRVMGIFVGPDRFNAAGRAALKINWATSQLVEPAIKAHWKDLSVQSLQLRHAVGIDASKVFAARTGARGNNDIVWVGRAPNYAARLATWRSPSLATMITAEVFQHLSGNVRDANGACRWAKDSRALGTTAVYSSNHHWKLD